MDLPVLYSDGVTKEVLYVRYLGEWYSPSWERIPRPDSVEYLFTGHCHLERELKAIESCYDGNVDCTCLLWPGAMEDPYYIAYGHYQGCPKAGSLDDLHDSCWGQVG